MTNIPELVATRSLLINGQWHEVEIRYCKAKTHLSLPGGTWFGWIAEYVNKTDQTKFLRVGVPVMAVRDEFADKLADWLPKAGWMVYRDFLCGKVICGELPFVEVRPTEEWVDPQCVDRRSFRLRCRHDVLKFVHDCMNSPQRRLNFTGNDVQNSPLLTRLYFYDEVESALNWCEKHVGVAKRIPLGVSYLVDESEDKRLETEIAQYNWEENATIQLPQSEAKDALEYDVFICHASEDKDEFVRSLAEALQKAGIKVWYDEFSLAWGDRLRVTIDKGLKNSRFGIVVLSKSFFAKNWPQYELDGLVQIETSSSTKKVLPIWHGVTKEEVEQYSPPLAGRFAIDSACKIERFVNEFLKLCQNRSATVDGVAKSDRRPPSGWGGLGGASSPEVETSGYDRAPYGRGW